MAKYRSPGLTGGWKHFLKGYEALKDKGLDLVLASPSHPGLTQSI